jgi:uncharacterized Zn finger protein
MSALTITSTELRGFEHECPECRGPGVGVSTGGARHNAVIDEWMLEYRCTTCGSVWHAHRAATADAVRVVVRAKKPKP